MIATSTVFEESPVLCCIINYIHYFHVCGDFHICIVLSCLTWMYCVCVYCLKCWSNKKNSYYITESRI